MKLAWCAIAAVAAALAVYGCNDDTNCHGPCDDGGGATGNAGGAGGEMGEGATDAAIAYCDCMLLACHDEYHAHYAPDTNEPLARELCLEEAVALPEAGMDVDMGNFVECRTHYCTEGMTDDTVCPNTIGGLCQ